MVGERGAEEPICPFLGQWSRFGEVDRHGRVADGERGEHLRDEPGLREVELEQVGVAILDHDRRSRERGDVRERVGELPVDQPANQVVETFALHNRDDLAVVRDPVVASRKRPALGARLLLCELVWVALAAIDEDREVREIGGAAARDADPGPGLAGGARGLPEDPLAPTLDAGEHKLGAVLPRPVEHEIDRHPAPLAGTDRDPFDDLGVIGPAVGAMAVDLRGPRPAIARLEHELPAGQWQADQERQRRVGVGVGGDLEESHAS